ncbi:MAG: zinc-dependent alcohol dehydrogenase [Armatimonadota bacterium]
MRAARLHAAKDMRIDEVPTPEAGPDEVLVRVRAVAICPSDLRLYHDGHASGVVPDHPMIQGHEFSGEIAALGEGVEGPPVGTRVAVEPSWHCGECDVCRAGHENLCRNIVFPSFPQRDGALAEYIACPAFSVQPLPDSVSDIEGALFEPLGVGIHAVRLSEVQPDDRVAILGAGTIGMCVMLVLQAKGVEQIAMVEPIEDRRTWPRELGAEPVVASHEELLEEDYEGDIVFECSGDNDAVEQAMRLARPAGRVVVVGIPHPDQVTFDSTIPRRRQLTVVFSRRSRDTLEESVELIASGAIELGALPVREYTLEQTAEAMEATAARPGDMLRAVVIP